jgi:hypothetical protein
MRSLIVASLALLTAAGAFAQTNPAALAARASHEGFLVACDPYQDAARAKELIGDKNQVRAGILPVEIYFQNSTGRAVAVDLDSIRLEITAPGQPRQRLEPLSLEYVVARTLHENPNPNLASPRRHLPHPFPSAGPDKKWRKLEARLGRLSLGTGMVPAGELVHGLLFFDLDGHFELLRYARLYVPEVEFADGHKPLMFFEVELGGGH